MTTLPPPPRYRVVEQGRRLVVIDTVTGQPATRSTPAAPRAKLPTGPERTDFGGSSTLVTHRLYDNKAPRTLTLDPGATTLIENARSLAIGFAVTYAVVAVFMPWVLVLLLVALNPKVRAAARQAATRWLDRYDADASAG